MSARASRWLDEFEDDFEDDFEATPTQLDLVGEFVESLTVAKLRALAKRNGWRVSGQKRADVEAAILDRFADPESIAVALSRLAAPTRQTLQLLLWLNGAHLADGIDRLLALAELAGDAYANIDRQRFGQALADLRGRGLLLVDHQGYLALTDGVRERIDPIPTLLRPRSTEDLAVDPAVDALVLLLRAATAIESRGRVELAWPWPQDVRWEENSFAPEQVWPIRGAQPPHGRPTRILAAGSWLASATRGAVSRALDLKSDPAADFFCGLLLLLDVIEPHPLDDEWARAREGWLEGLLQAGSVALAERLLGAWMALPYGVWDLVSQAAQAGEMQALRRMGYYADPPLAYDDLLSFQRWMALGALTLLPRGEERTWVDLDGYIDAIGRSQPEMVIPSFRRSGFGLTPPGGSEALEPNDPRAWDLLGAPLLRRMIDGPLRWLGLVELARDARGRPRAIRRTAQGDALQLLQSMPPGEAAAPVWDRTNWSCRVPVSWANAELIAGLLSLGRKTGFEDDVLQIQLEAERVTACLEAGQPVDTALARIEAAGALPEGLSERIDAWSERWGRINLESGAALIELDAESLATEILAGTDLRERILYRVDPKTWLIDAADLEGVVAELERAGYRPRIVDAPSLEESESR